MDDACEPRQAINVANRNVSQKIGFVVGHVCSGSTTFLANLLEAEGSSGGMNALRRL
jgi:branched-chain amino acid transport system substrate-binding protein